LTHGRPQLADRLRTTAEHPFRAEGSGLTRAGELQPGGRVRTERGWTEVVSVSSTEVVATVYNLSVEADHTYFVGGSSDVDAAWVHNSGGDDCDAAAAKPHVAAPAAGPVATRESLLGDLAKGGVRHSPDKVVVIGRDASGKVVFLEQGNAKAGLQHIVDAHGADFARRGIPVEQVPDAVLAAATRGRPVGMQGTRPIYEVEFNGQTHRIAVTVGDNGFIVGANPAGK